MKNRNALPLPFLCLSVVFDQKAWLALLWILKLVVRQFLTNLSFLWERFQWCGPKICICHHYKPRTTLFKAMHIDSRWWPVQLVWEEGRFTVLDLSYKMVFIQTQKDSNSKWHCKYKLISMNWQEMSIGFRNTQRMDVSNILSWQCFTKCITLQELRIDYSHHHTFLQYWIPSQD